MDERPTAARGAFSAFNSTSALIAVAVITVLLLALTSCGDDSADGSGGDASAASRTATIEPCTLLSDAELAAVLGTAPAAEESEPAGPFTGCSWGTGDIIVSIAPSDSVILAPGEEGCPSADLGDESYRCEGRVKFLVDGIHVTVSTINGLITDDQLVALAQRVSSRLSG